MMYLIKMYDDQQSKTSLTGRIKDIVKQIYSQPFITWQVIT